MKHFELIGAGQTLFVLFLGFGQSSRWAHEMHACLGGTDLLAVYLPDKGAFCPSKILEEVQQIVAEHACQQVCIWAFSIGTLPALSMLSYAPACFSKAFLLAPEGLRPHWLYRLATVFPLLLRAAVAQASFVRQIARVVHSMGFLSKEMYWLLRKYMSQKSRIAYLQDIWMHYAKCMVSDRVLQHEGAHVFLGEHDKEVPYARIAYRLANVPACRLHKLPVGHFELPAYWLQLFASNRGHFIGGYRST